VTAYDSYAIRAFEVHAVDYLLKPFGADRLAEALARARLRMGSHEKAPTEVASLARARHVPIDRILVRDRSDVHVIPISRVDYIESQDDYASIKAGGRSYLKEQTLAELEALLDPKTFVRIHRRFILNITRLAKIELGEKDSRIAVLADATQLPISRAGYARLRELL
jgi:two-component system LytT family response regulator